MKNLKLKIKLNFPARYYTISASKVFRANSNYHISVTNHDGAVPAEIQVGIVGDGSNAYSNLKTITVDPDTTKIVDLDVSSAAFPTPKQSISFMELLSGWSSQRW